MGLNYGEIQFPEPGGGPTGNFGFWQHQPNQNGVVWVDAYIDERGNIIAPEAWVYNKDGSASRSQRWNSNPNRPIFNNTQINLSPTISVKQASPDIIVFDEEIDPEFLVQTFFQEFGGTELINISRYDLINGEQVSYSPIINLSSIRQSFNPNNIIAIGAFQENPTQYGIDLFSRGITDPYFDEFGNLVIEINDVRPDESIEIEIASDGTINRIEL